MATEARALRALTERLERLERDARRWRTLTGGTLAVLALIVLLGAAGPTVSDDIRARRLLLVDPRGRSSLEATPVGIKIHSRDGRRVVELSAESGSPRVVLQSRDGRSGASMEILPDATPLVNLTRGEGESRAWLALGSEGRAALHLRGSNLQGGAELTVERTGTARLVLYDKENDRDAILEVPIEGSPGFVLRKEGKPRAVLSLLVNDLPFLDLRDGAGHPRATLGVGLDGSPTLTFYDQEGTGRADLSLRRQGSPRFELADHEGAARVVLGDTTPARDRRAVPPMGDGVVGLSLAILAADGKTLWKAP